jgi:hypothetical protein
MDKNQLSLELLALARLLQGQDRPFDEEAALGLGYILERIAEEVATLKATR